jgi:hypothetical protein
VAGNITTQPKQGWQARPISSLCILLCLWFVSISCLWYQKRKSPKIFRFWPQFSKKYEKFLKLLALKKLEWKWNKTLQCDYVICGRTPHHVKMKGLRPEVATATGWKKVGYKQWFGKKMWKILEIIIIKKQEWRVKFTRAMM